MHTLVTGDGIGRVSGTQISNGGQQSEMGRYPLHMHLNLAGNNSKASYFEDNSIVNSNFRCVTIHGTNGSRISRNVAYNVHGHCFYLEDGVEEENTFEYNLAAHIHPIFRPANGRRKGEVFEESKDLLFPGDVSASAYYISNAYNTFRGNAASGGWASFAFVSLPFPVGLSKGIDYGRNNPHHRPTLSFEGNTAHSSSFYEEADTACIYVAGKVTYAGEKGNTMVYNSGRHTRTTQLPNGEDVPLFFKNTKTWLCDQGLVSWGGKSLVKFFESHDNRRGLRIAGESFSSSHFSTIYSLSLSLSLVGHSIIFYLTEGPRTLTV